MRWKGKGYLEYYAGTLGAYSAPLPWPQLTHIELRLPLSAKETLFIIQSCSKLTDFDVILNRDVHGSLSCEMVVNNSLQKLQLLAYDICDPLFERLVLPSLIDISVCFMEIRTPVFQKQLLRFFSRSKCKLDRLCYDAYFGEAELFECLKHDNLQILASLDTPILADTILVALTDQADVAVKREETLTDVQDHDATYSVIMKLVHLLDVQKSVDGSLTCSYRPKNKTVEDDVQKEEKGDGS
ncbi:hypothetical protein F5887DRAFT_1193388 [Amanita rubescens]|nr:hypothetical protein F5887DRAFT_1193388 [Amanita rubescens]